MEKENKNDFWEKLNSGKAGKKLGKDQFIIFILIGLLLIVVALPTSKSSEIESNESGLMDSNSSKIEVTEETALKSDMDMAGDEVEEYERYVEDKLEKAISSMEGVGKVKVIVYVGESKEAIVEKDIPVKKSDTTENDAEGGNRSIKEEEYTEETIYTKENNGDSIPYVIKMIQPKIEGIVVIAQGGGNTEVRNNITESIMALFNIEQHKIKVVKMKSE